MDDRDPVFDELVNAWLAGQATAAEQDTLEGLVADDPLRQAELRSQFRQHLQLAAILAAPDHALVAARARAVLAAGRPSGMQRTLAGVARRRRRARAWWPAAAAALVMALIVPLWLRWPSHLPAPLALVSTATQGAIVDRNGVDIPLNAGFDLRPQDRIRVPVEPSQGLVMVRYPDQTRMEMQAGTQARVWDEDGAKRVRLERGSLRCEVAHQPSGHAMKLLTSQGEAEVVGTRLTLSADQTQTRLAVEEGAVALRRADGANVLVHGGHQAVMAADVPLEVHPIPLQIGAHDALPIRLTGQSSQPAHSCFVLGQAVQLSFSASGLPPRGRDQLILNIVDERQVVIEDRTIPVTADSAGDWQQTIDAPHRRLGFYRAYARLASGATIPGLESRPAGFLTYAVVPDPAQRPALALESSFFGIAVLPVNVPALPALLGSRWATVGRWNDDCPRQPLSAIAPKVITWPRRPDGTAWNVYPAFTAVAHAGRAPWADQVFVPGTAELGSSGTGRLVAGSGEEIFRRHCIAEAQARMRDYPGLSKRIYQITESDDNWGTNATAGDLARIYEIAYPAIHSVDPRAVVIGVAFGMHPTAPRRPTYDQLYDAGLFAHLDAVSIHLYLNTRGAVDADQAPETVVPSQGQAIGELKAWMRQRLGRELPVYGTEQGFNPGADPDPLKELRQAHYHIRSNLILLGEGLAFHWSFSGTDYVGAGSYGITYNLGADDSTAQVGPKPVVAAYAAMTFLLEGRTRARPLSGLGPTGLGYAYANGNDEVLALWDYGTVSNPVEVMVGAPEATVYDWMGNARQMATRAGMLHLQLGNEPIYVVKPAK